MEWTDPISAYLYPTGALPSGTSGDFLQSLGDSCQAAIEKDIGRQFESAPYFEVRDGDDRSLLILEHDWIQSLVSVSVNGIPFTVQTTPSYNASAPPTFPLPQCVVRNRQTIQLTDGNVFSSGLQNVFVSYTAGLSAPGGEIPADLKLAVVYWATQFFKNRDKVGMTNVNAGQQVTTFTHNIPKDIRLLIAGWRRVYLP